MKIKNDNDLAIASREAGQILQDIQDYLSSKNLIRSEVQEAKVRFPRGFIRTASSQKPRLRFIKNKILGSNVAYNIMLSDTIMWLLNRTDIAGIAKGMLFKVQIIIVAAIVESLTKEYLKKICGDSYRFKNRTEFLVKKDIISQKLKEKLDWIWDKRSNNIHLFKLDESEYSNDYTKDNHIKCISSLRELLQDLNTKKLTSVSSGTL
jgi:hypothetical protein